MRHWLLVGGQFFTLLALCSMGAGLGASSANAELVISVQVSEPIIVLQKQIVADGEVPPIIALPNGSNLYGNQLTIACLGQTNTVDPLLVYGLSSRRCEGLTQAAPSLAVQFLGLDTGASESTRLLDESPFLIIVPPGEGSVGGLEEMIFADGFE